MSNSSGESAAREPQPWRVGHKVPINVYDEWGNPVCQCHTPAVAELIVKAVNLSRHYAARAREEWIPVSDAPLGVAILIHVTTSCYPMIATRTQVGWFSAASAHCIDESVITHWRPLPAAPLAAKGETGNVAAQGEQHD